MNERKVLRFVSLPSTSDYAKQLRGQGKNAVIIAQSQTGGRGTKGRSFSSEQGGLYLSLLTFYKNFPATKAFELMQNACVAVCETLVHFGLKPTIKWPNDVYVNGRKICGILIENTFSEGRVACSVVGIGLNVRNPLPIELAEIATTIKAETGRNISVLEVEEKLLSLLDADLKGEYERFLGYKGQTVVLEIGNERFSAQIVGVDAHGNLVVNRAGERATYASAEIALFVKE